MLRLAIVLVLASAVAHADVPDASLRAVRDRVVRLELADATTVEGRLIGFEPDTITIARAPTNEVVTYPRAQVQRLFALEVVPPAPPPRPERLRVVGVSSSLLGTVMVDADYGRLRGFASVNLLFPILTASGSGGTWLAAAVGAGTSFPLGRRWRLDVFGQVAPLRTTSYYTYLGFGAGAGAHYTSASGLSVGITFPVIGFATRLGSSPTGYDASFKYGDSLSYYYLTGIAGMPLLTFGYRFATNRVRAD